MKLPSYQDAVFVLDPAAGLTDGNLWRDSAPHGIDITPNANFAAPNYGLGIGPSGASYIEFGGGGVLQSGSLPLRFYDYAPPGPCTWAFVVRHMTPTPNANIFDCRPAAGNRGLRLAEFTTSQCDMQWWDAGGVQRLVRDPVGLPANQGRTVVRIFSADTDLSVGYVWRDRTQYAPITVFGGTRAYDTAQTPWIGSTRGLAQFWTGWLYFLGLWGRVWADSESDAFTRFWQDRT